MIMTQIRISKTCIQIHDEDDAKEVFYDARTECYDPDLEKSSTLDAFTASWHR